MGPTVLMKQAHGIDFITGRHASRSRPGAADWIAKIGWNRRAEQKERTAKTSALKKQHAKARQRSREDEHRSRGAKPAGSKGCEVLLEDVNRATGENDHRTERDAGLNDHHR